MIKSLCLIAVVLGAVPFLLGLYYTLLTGKEQKDKEADNVLLHMAAM